MQISFFEEFPTKEDLAKIKFVSFPTKLYIGAKSLEEFEKIKVPSRNVKEKIYWPILEKREGYWFSPFSKRSAIDRTIKELKGAKVSIMWDAELPTRHNLFLYLTQLLSFFSNRQKIRDFLKSKKKIYTAEYFPSSALTEKIFYFLGLNFRTENHRPIKMMYSSMHPFSEEKMRNEIEAGKKKYGRRLRIGLGTLIHGILGNEPAINPDTLERDLRICRQEGVQEVILFRLGGMNKEYKKVIERFKSTE